MKYMLICFIGSNVTIESYYTKEDALNVLIAKRDKLGSYFPANIVEYTKISNF